MSAVHSGIPGCVTACTLLTDQLVLISSASLQARWPRGYVGSFYFVSPASSGTVIFGRPRGCEGSFSLAEAAGRRQSRGEGAEGGEETGPASGHWASLSPALGGHATLDNLRVLSGRCVLILASWTRCPFVAPSRGLTEFVRGNGRPRRG